MATHALQTADDAVTPENSTTSPPLYSRMQQKSLRRIRTTRTLIVVFLVTPLLLATAWMWSMWDPSHYLDEIELAVVNEDEGVTQNGVTTNYGADIVTGLLETDYLNFTETTAAEADAGLHNGDYMFVVSIPRNFSEQVITVIDPEPVQPNIIISYNDFYGTNTPLLTSGVVPGIQQGVSQGIAEGYAQEILDGMNQLGSGLEEAAAGAYLVDDGARQLNEGAIAGIDGAYQLDDGARQLHDGTTELLDGAYQLDDGVAQLRAGTRELGDGAAQIDAGVNQLTSALIPLLRQVGNAAQILQPIATTLERFGLHAQAQQIWALLAAFDNNNPEGVANQLQKLEDGTAELSWNLNAPEAPYNVGLNQLKGGTEELIVGAQQLNDGTYLLKDGTGQLVDGTVELVDGTTLLYEGTTELYTGLAAGALEAPQIEDISSSSTQMAMPVLYTDEWHNPVQTVVDITEDPTDKVLSAGVSIILVLVFGYLGMAIISMLAPHILGRRKFTSAAKQVCSGLGLMMLCNLVLLGILALLSLAAGWNVQAPLAMVFTLVVLAFNGTAIYQMLRIMFGRLIGGTLALGVYGYGIFCSGAVWPLETTPTPLRALHYFHPISYARIMFNRATDGNIDGSFWGAAALLIVTSSICVGLAILVRRKHMERIARLQHAMELEMLPDDATQTQETQPEAATATLASVSSTSSPSPQAADSHVDDEPPQKQ